MRWHDGAVTTDLGAAFAQAMAEKDHAAIRELLHPEIDFHAMTPRRTWHPADIDEIIATVATWFDDNDAIESVEHVETDHFADRERVGYRFRVRNADGLHLVEQQAYLGERDGRIDWLRIVCSGYRPIPG